MFIIKRIKSNNFNTNNKTDMSYMLNGCSDVLKTKIKSENKSVEDKAFWN